MPLERRTRELRDGISQCNEEISWQWRDRGRRSAANLHEDDAPLARSDVELEDGNLWAEGAGFRREAHMRFAPLPIQAGIGQYHIGLVALGWKVRAMLRSKRAAHFEEIGKIGMKGNF